MLSLLEAIERLQSPYAFEAFSALTGEPLLGVDLRTDEPRLAPGALNVALERLEQLPCPSLAIAGGDLSPTARRVAACCDVVVATEAELEPVLGAVKANPLATTVLVQLVRQSESNSFHHGLIAESLAYSTLQAGPEFATWLQGRGSAPGRGAGPPLGRRAKGERSQPGAAVLLERRGDTLHLTLNRAERHNAFSTEMRDALHEALAVVVGDPSVREVVLRGDGPSFCSGGDLDEFGTFPDPATAHGVRSTRHPARLLAAVADRVRVHVHGACVGAGIELPAFARHVSAAQDAFFQLPEVAMGLVPGAGGTVSLPQRIGRQRTAWLALSGQRLDVATALEWGLVDEVE